MHEAPTAIIHVGDGPLPYPFATVSLYLAARATYLWQLLRDVMVF